TSCLRIFTGKELTAARSDPAAAARCAVFYRNQKAATVPANRNTQNAQRDTRSPSAISGHRRIARLPATFRLFGGRIIFTVVSFLRSASTTSSRARRLAHGAPW